MIHRYKAALHSDIVKTIGSHIVVFALIVSLLFGLRFPVSVSASSPYNASDVLGQDDFTTSVPNAQVLGVPNQYGLNTPQFTAVDSTHHRLFVSEATNNRVLVFNLDGSDVPLDHQADFVLGQPNFSTNTAATSQVGLSGPAGLAYDVAGDRLFVADNTNSRVLVYDVAVISNGEPAANVLGQADFDSAVPGTFLSGLNSPTGLAYSATGSRLFVADGGSGPVLVFDVASITDGEPAVNKLGGPNGDWTTSFDTPESTIRSTTFDSTNGVIYAGTAFDGIIYRCATATGCDGAGDWTVSFDTPDLAILSLLFDSTNGVIYAGANTDLSSGIIYRCATATGCDTAGDWTVSFNISGGIPASLTLDTIHSVIYAGTDNGGDIFRCDTSTNCDASGDWTTSFASTEVGILSLTFDNSGNGIIYAGTVANGIIYRCNTFIGCDESSDWMVSFNTPETFVQALMFDTTNNVVYAGAGDKIYRCDSTTNCDSAGDWTLSYNPSFQNILSFTFDSTHGVIYAGTGNNGIIYRCDTATDCDAAGDWAVTFGTYATTNPDTGIFTLGFDSTNGVIYAGAGSSEGFIYRCDTATGCSSVLINGPFDVAYDPNNDRLFATDITASRVLVFDVASITDGEDPINVLGQDDFLSSGSATTQDGLNNPKAVGYDVLNNRLFVGDFTNNRVMVFDVDPAVLIANTPATDGPNAINVLGQDDFVSNFGAVTQDGLSAPVGIAHDPLNGHLFVVDSQNNRVMVFDVDPAVLIANDAGTDGPNALDEVGQVDASGNPAFTSQSADNQSFPAITSVTAHGMSSPLGTVIDTVHHRLFVADSGNVRVLEYDLDSNNTLVDHTADHVLGQTDFLSSSIGTTQNTLSSPTGLVYDSLHNRLFVTDENNQRVMVFDVSVIVDGENAINVLGQPGFVTSNPVTTQDGLFNPIGVALDVTGQRLFVADNNNNRVMVFNVDPAVLVADTPATDGPDAVHVLGQLNYSATVATTSQSNFYGPYAVSYDANGGRLFVSDYVNNRVMVFNVTSITNGEPAVNVLGQADFVSFAPATTQSGLSAPDGLTYDTENDRLFVSDLTNNRVMVFNADPTVLIADNAGTDGPNAVAVLGQDGFAAGGANTTQSGLASPAGLDYDQASKRLYISDTNNSRVIIDDFVRITATTMPNGSTGTSYSQTVPTEDSQGTLSFAVTAGALPPGLSLDSSFGDITGTPTTLGTYNFTVQVTDDNAASGTFIDSQAMTLQVVKPGYVASDVLGQTNITGAAMFTTSDQDDGVNAQGFNLTTGTEIDAINHRLFVSDRSNQRVLVFNLDPSNQLVDRTADHVLGQPDFISNAGTATQAGLSAPGGLVYDAAGSRLFVADTGNNRVLVYDTTTITDGENAINVLGQVNFTAHAPDVTQSTFNGAISLDLAYDTATDRLFVADAENNRVLVFDADPAVLIANNSGTDGPNAVNVLGQPDYVTNTSGVTTQSSLDRAGGLAFDAATKRLFVGDQSNDRVMVFNVDPAVLIPNNTGTDGPNAINVLGHTNFTNFTDGQAQNRLRNPVGLSFDPIDKRLFVADQANNRIMVFNVDPAVLIANNSGTDGPNAINLLCQTTYGPDTTATTQNGCFSPTSLMYDSVSQHLFLADTQNSRLLVFDADPAVLIANNSGTDGPNAIDALGQLDENDNPYYVTKGINNSPNKSGFSGPTGIEIDRVHHRLFVADQTNQRILVFNLDANNDLIDRTADFVLGQPNFRENALGTTQSTLNTPYDLAYDSTNDRLFVADSNNSRVMVFSTASITNGENAVNVIGHTAYDNSDTPGDQNGFGGSTTAVEYDATNNRLFVGAGSRIMVFNVDPAVLIPNNTGTDGPNAINLIGHTAYDNSDTPGDQNGLSGTGAYGLAYDATNNRLFVADVSKGVLVFDVDPAVLIANNAGTNGPNAINIIGHTVYDNSDTPTTQNGFSNLAGITLDSIRNRLFVADGPNNNRIMVFNVDPAVLIPNNTGTDGPNAVSVLGQPDYNTLVGHVSQSGLFVPWGLASDAVANRLYVADQQNQRAIVYDFVRITTTTLPDATVGQPYNQTLSTVNDQGIVSFALFSGTLPPGLTVSSVTGTPTTPGTYNFTVRGTDDNGAFGSFIDDQSYTIIVTGGAAPTPTPTPAPGGGGGGGGAPGGPVVPPPVVTPVPTSPIPTSSVFPTPSLTTPPTPLTSPSSSPVAVASPTTSIAPGVSPSSLPSSSGTPPTGEPSPGGSSPGSSIIEAISTAIQTLGRIFTNILDAVVPEVKKSVPAVADTSVAIAVGSAVAATAPFVQSISVLGNIIQFLRQYLFEVFGLKRKRKPWGTVYDARTKQPLPFAKVQLLDPSLRVLETRITDQTGRYGFLLTPKSLKEKTVTVQMAPSKQGYGFPSSHVTSPTDTALYPHVYSGGPTTLGTEAVAGFDVPMDPVVPPDIPRHEAPSQKINQFIVTLLDVAFYIGLVTVPLNYILNPTSFHLVVMIVFFGANIFRLGGIVQKPFGIVRDAATGKALAFTLITLQDTSGKRVDFTVSDDRGRYFLLAPKGNYVISAYTPAGVVPARTKDTKIKTEKGWIKKQFTL